MGDTSTLYMIQGCPSFYTIGTTRVTIIYQNTVYANIALWYGNEIYITKGCPSFCTLLLVHCMYTIVYTALQYGNVIWLYPVPNSGLPFLMLNWYLVHNSGLPFCFTTGT